MQLQEKIQSLKKHYEKVLDDIGEDKNREGLLNTPERVAKSMVFLTAGYEMDPVAIINSAKFKEDYHDMVLIKDTEFYSMCEHHMLPFFGKVHVVHVPAYSPYAVAEHAMALLLTSIRRIHKAYNRTREFNFSLSGLTGFDLHGKTVGVIGTGKIGRIFIDICRGFGMKIIAYDAFPAENSGIEYVELDELFQRSDIISLHCPLTEQTRHLIGEKAIGKMKKGVVIVNTSRGGLIDAEALLKGIKDRKIGAACLDVYEEEADIFFEDRSGHILDDELLSRLISMPNVIVTSHQAFLTEDALNNIAETTVRNILSYFENDGICDNELCYRCGNIDKCRKERQERCF